MKKYSAQQKSAALKTLPQPLVDFLASKELGNIYTGIAEKLKLNYRQLLGAIEVTNATLLSLEPESAIETNIHQVLPELSNTATRELVDDINDRIFKEARRRVKENVLAPSPVWDTDEWGPKEQYRQSLESDTAFAARIKSQEEKTGKPYIAEADMISQKEAEAAKNDPFEETPRPLLPLDFDTSIEGIDANENDIGENPETATVPPRGIQKIELAKPKIEIAAAKLQAPSLGITTDTEVVLPKITNVAVTPKPPTPTQTTPAAPAPQPSPATPKDYKGTDPYRESTD